MDLKLPKTRAGWITLGVAVAVIVGFLYFFTDEFHGHAVEVSVENGDQSEIFATIDNTGRHGENTAVVTMQTTGGGVTSPGVRIEPGGSRSLGLAVGLFDSPTLHVWRVNPAGRVDASQVFDCAFDTIDYSKLKLPSVHVRLKWTGHGCKRDDVQ